MKRKKILDAGIKDDQTFEIKLGKKECTKLNDDCQPGK